MIPVEKVGKAEAETEPLSVTHRQVIAKGRLYGANLIAGSTEPGA